jgi:hypothetical protein
MGRWRRPDLEDGWVDRATAAQMLGKTVRTLLRWHRQGKGPPRRHNGNGIRYRISEIEDWLRPPDDDRRSPPHLQARAMIPDSKTLTTATKAHEGPSCKPEENCNEHDS